MATFKGMPSSSLTINMQSFTVPVLGTREHPGNDAASGLVASPIAKNENHYQMPPRNNTSREINCYRAPMAQIQSRDLHRKHITLKHITKERKRGICVPVDGATVDACRLRVADIAIGKTFVVVLDAGSIVIASWKGAEE